MSNLLLGNHTAFARKKVACLIHREQKRNEEEKITIDGKH